MREQDFGGSRVGNNLMVFHGKRSMLTEIFILPFTCSLQKTKVIWPSPYNEDTVGCYPKIPLTVMK